MSSAGKSGTVIEFDALLNALRATAGLLNALRATAGSSDQLPAMSEHQQTFLKTWVERGSDIHGGLPARADFAPNKFAKLMPYALGLDVQPDAQDFVVRLMGTSVRDYTDADYTGQRLTEVGRLGPGTPYFDQLMKVTQEQVPDYAAHIYNGPRIGTGSLSVLCLPLADDGKTVNKIFQIVQYFRIDGTPTR